MKKESTKVAVVTGASSGIGQAAANRLAIAGFKVYGTSRQSTASTTAFQMLPLDVTSEASTRDLIGEVVRREGRIDVLVNNAGFGLKPSAAEESTIAQAQAVFNTNFMGVVRMANAVLPVMREQKSGRIINIGSVLGFLPMPFMAMYSASKHAVEGYSEALDHEVRAFGGRISLVDPSYIKTAFDENGIAPDAPLEIYRKVCDTVDKRVKIALSSADGPEVVAEAILKAATDRKHHLRYTPGLANKTKFMRRFLPERVLDAGIRKNLGI